MGVTGSYEAITRVMSMCIGCGRQLGGDGTRGAGARWILFRRLIMSSGQGKIRACDHRDKCRC
jgi:hypothetical protein